MAFTETNFKEPTRHNPYLHQIIIKDIVKRQKKGHVLDIPSGPGYLLRDLIALGYTGVASEIDESLHCFSDLKYAKVDMTKTFPFEAGTFDYVISVEGIEHIDNHYAFLKEVRRVLKPGGMLYLTTPNIGTLESRWNYFISGFHSMASKPIPLDTKNIYFEHINPISLNQLYFYCSKANLSFDHITTHRFKKGSVLLFVLFFPLILLGIYRACFWLEKDSQRQIENRKLFRFLVSFANLFGSHTVIAAKSLLEDSAASRD